MGGSHSKPKKKDFVQTIKANVEEEIARRMMIQREVQMAINIARARDSLNYFGSAWCTLVGGVVTARAMGQAVPPIAGVPIVVGALALGNMADMAYGNKLARVNKEAQHILENERPRFVPFKQAPFAHFYTSEEAANFFDPATPVGDVFPSRLFSRNFVPEKK